MLGAIARYPAGKDFAPLSCKLFQPPDILIVNVLDFIHAETADLFLRSPVAIPSHYGVPPFLANLRNKLK